MNILRPMTVADLPAIDTVQRASFLPELWEDMALFKDILAHFDQSSFVAEKDHSLMGYLLTHPTYIKRNDFEYGCQNLDGSEDYIYIHDLCVCPKARGMGVARLLLEHLYIFARDNGFLKLCAIAVQGAERFWLRQNFVKVKPYSYNGTSGNGTPGTLMVREI